MHHSHKLIMDYYFGQPKAIAEKILFIKRDTRIAEYKSYIDSVIEFGNVWHGFTGNLRGEKVTVIVTGVGPSAVGDCVYALHRPYATCVYSGTCGSLNADLHIGQYLIASKAICCDGFSALCNYAFGAEVSAAFEVSASLKSAFSILCKEFCEGTTFTTASVVRENDPDFWKFVPEGVTAIEMGCASFLVSASLSHKKAAAYFWTTDAPVHNRSFFDDLPVSDLEAKQRAYEEAVRVDIAILSSL